MAAELFSEWMAYAQLEPFGEDRMDLRFADFQALYANAHRGKGKPAFEAKHFLRRFDEDHEERQRKRAEGQGKAAVLSRKIAETEKRRAAKEKEKAAERRAERQRQKGASSGA